MSRETIIGLLTCLSFVCETAAEEMARDDAPPPLDPPRYRGPAPDVDASMAGVIDTLQRAGIGRTTPPPFDNPGRMGE